MTFTTDDAQVFGCTNPDASNYNMEASYENGSCEFATDNGPMADLFDLEDSNWNVFPNPVFEGHFSIQFDKEVNLGSENIIVEVTDMSGKTAISQEVTSGDVIGGNRIMEARPRCRRLHAERDPEGLLCRSEPDRQEVILLLSLIHI